MQTVGRKNLFTLPPFNFQRHSLPRNSLEFREFAVMDFWVDCIFTA